MKGKVSHAFLYKYWKVEGAHANAFQYINDSKLERLLGGGSSGGGGGKSGLGFGMPPSMPGGDANQSAAAPAESLAPAWTPLAGGGVSVSFGSSMGPSMGGGSKPMTPGAGLPNQAVPEEPSAPFPRWWPTRYRDR